MKKKIGLFVGLLLLLIGSGASYVYALSPLKSTEDKASIEVRQDGYLAVMDDTGYKFRPEDFFIRVTDAEGKEIDIKEAIEKKN